MIPGATGSPFSVEFTPNGPLAERLRFSCKEMYDIKGWPATCGHPRFAQTRNTEATSAIISHLEKAGSVLVGKTLQSELAISSTGENPHYAMPINPRRPGAAPGGSSTGCAVAVATDHADFSVATDTAGSARIPAACCDVLGVSLIPRDWWFADAVSLSPTLDQLGLLARTPAVMKRVLAWLQLDQKPEAAERVVVPTWLLSRCHTEMQQLFREAVKRLTKLGIRVDYIPGDSFSEVNSIQAMHGSIALAEIARSLASFLDEWQHEVTSAIVDRLRPYLGWSEVEIRHLRNRVRAPLTAFRSTTSEPVLLPTIPMLPPQYGSNASLGDITRFANLMGENSISIPMTGVGISIMIIDSNPATLLTFADRLQELT